MNNHWLSKKTSCDQRGMPETPHDDYVELLEAKIIALEAAQREFQTTLEKGYGEAYQIICDLREQHKNDLAAVHAEYDDKVVKLKEYIVDKVDQFLKTKGLAQCACGGLLPGICGQTVVDRALK